MGLVCDTAQNALQLTNKKEHLQTACLHRLSFPGKIAPFIFILSNALNQGNTLKLNCVY
jgi:hypothetical protein